VRCTTCRITRSRQVKSSGALISHCRHSLRPKTWALRIHTTAFHVCPCRALSVEQTYEGRSKSFVTLAGAKRPGLPKAPEADRLVHMASTVSWQGAEEDCNCPLHFSVSMFFFFSENCLPKIQYFSLEEIRGNTEYLNIGNWQLSVGNLQLPAPNLFNP